MNRSAMVPAVSSRTRRASEQEQVYTVFVVLALFQGLEPAVYISPDAAGFDVVNPNCTPVAPKDLRETFPRSVIDKLEPGEQIWLPIKRAPVNESGGWFWISGEFYGNQLSSPLWHKKGMDCAALRAGDGIIDDTYCSASYSMYMCDSTQKCSNQSVVCVEDGGVYYSILMESGNWYQALQRCKAHGRRLAVIIADRKKILAKIKDKMQEYVKRDVWIGLRQKEYQWTDGKQVEEFRWQTQSFCTCPELNCVAAVREREELVWKQQHCRYNESHHLCVKLQIGGIGRVYLVIPMAAVGTTCLIGTVFVIVVLWRRKKRSQNQSSSILQKGGSTQPLVDTNVRADDGACQEQDSIRNRKAVEAPEGCNLPETKIDIPKSKVSEDAAALQPVNSDTDTRVMDSRSKGQENSPTGPIVLHAAGDQQTPHTQQAESIHPPAKTQWTKPKWHNIPDMEDCEFCQRKKCLVLCHKCGHRFIGRIRTTCDFHGSPYIMDSEACPGCEGPLKWLQEQREPIQKPELGENDLRHKIKGSKAAGDKKAPEDDYQKTSRPAQAEEKEIIKKMIATLAKELSEAYLEGGKKTKKGINDFINHLHYVDLMQIREEGVQEVMHKILADRSATMTSLYYAWRYWEDALKQYNIPGVERLCAKIRIEINVA